MSTLENLRAARERYAASPSHAPYKQHPTGGTNCPITALGEATGWRAALDERKALADAAGVKFDGSDNEPLITWNAENDTATVLAAFDKAIANLTPEPEPDPEGWAIFIDHDERVSRIRDKGQDHLWPGASPVDAVQQLRDRYPDVGYESNTFYVNSQRGNATGFGLTRVKFAEVPVTTTELRAVAS